MKKILLLVFSLLISFLLLTSCEGGAKMSSGKVVTNKLVKYEEGIRNPLMGFRGNSAGTYHYKNFFTTVSKQYFEWNLLEKNASVTFDDFIKVSDEKFHNTEETNIKFIPRVYLKWPDKNDEQKGEYWPSDMTKGDYESQQFKVRLTIMVKKMAKAWDNDPRVAYIELGIFGYWGEQHTPFATEEMQAFSAKLFNEQFKNKKIMVRMTKSDFFSNNNYGIYWDEWGSEMQWEVWDEINLVLTDKFKDRWKTAVFGGENTFNMNFDLSLNGGKFMTFGLDYPFFEEEAMTKCANEIKKYAGLTHTNHVGMHIEESKLSAEGLAGFSKAQASLGYKMVISDAKYHSSAKPGEAIGVEINITNEGVSPFYYDWPIGFALIKEGSSTPVYSGVFEGASTIDYMPGEDWDVNKAEYKIKPKTHKVQSKFILPKDLPQGEYIVAVTMLDPAGIVPAARFANKAFIQGGYTGIGYIGIGKEPSKTEFTSKYDQLYDLALRYYKNLALFSKATVNGKEVTEATDGYEYTGFKTEKGKKTEITVELKQESTILSIETHWNKMPNYKVMVSSDGKSFTNAQETIKARNEAGRNICRAEKIKFIKIEYTNENSAGEMLNSINIFGV